MRTLLVRLAKHLGLRYKACHLDRRPRFCGRSGEIPVFRSGKDSTWRKTALALLLFAASHAHAQVVGQNTQPGSEGTYKISVSTKLVVESVSVTDKQGKAITGLTAKDFEVTEDGKPQQVRICEYQELPSAPEPAPARPHEENVTVYNRLAVTQIEPESPGKVKYKDRRLIAMYFDLTSLPPGDKLRALEAAEKFVRTQMTSADLIALMRYGGASVDVLQDFTADKDRLLSILQTLIIGENQQTEDTSSGDAATADTGAAFGQDNGEFNLFNTDRQLSALQTAAKMLGRLSEKKVLIYFASGLTLHGVDNQAQLHATVNDAIRSGVAFWPVDARGLVAQAPLGDATQGSPGNAGMYSGTAALAVQTRLQQSQDTLYALAGDTGGKALLDYNDLTRGITQAQHSLTSYYILGYYTSNSALDGRFRKIKVSVSGNTEAKLDYRLGYYAGKEFAKFTPADKERQLEDALMLGDPVTELSLAMEVNYFQLNRAEYFVPIVIKIPGSELALAKKRGAQHTLIDFLLEVRDQVGGNTVQNLRDNVDIKLTDTTAAEISRRPVEYDTGFTLLPGKYTIKFLARDDDTGRIGTFQTTVTIPNLNREARRVAISSVVLSGQRVDLKNALFNVAKDKDRAKQDAANPLVLNGQKLIPSVTRVFSKSRDLFVYLQAYEQGASSAQAAQPAPAVTEVQPLVTFVSFYQGDTKVFETQPMEADSASGTTLKTLPLRFSIGLDALPVGAYTCQVTVLNPSAGKSAFWEAPITIVP